MQMQLYEARGITQLYVFYNWNFEHLVIDSFNLINI